MARCLDSSGKQHCCCPHIMIIWGPNIALPDKWSNLWPAPSKLFIIFMLQLNPEDCVLHASLKMELCFVADQFLSFLTNLKSVDWNLEQIFNPACSYIAGKEEKNERRRERKERKIDREKQDAPGDLYHGANTTNLPSSIRVTHADYRATSFIRFLMVLLFPSLLW